MMATVSGCIANMILDPVAIFVLDMGVAGAAIATVIGQLLGAVVTVWYFFHTKTFRLQRSSFRLQGNILGKILPLGASSLLTQVSTVIVLAVMNNILVHYGTMSEYGPDIPLTVYGIIMKIFSLVTSVIIGLALGTQPIVGYNWFIQQKVISEIAAEESCVIVGRCADYILRGKADCLNVFIHADKEKRAERIIKEYGEQELSPLRLLEDKDKRRATYYRFYTHMEWGKIQNYHIALDSGVLGIDRCVELIAVLY